MKALGAVRMSQLVSVYGPGAIVDLPTLSVIIAGLNHWTTRPEDAIDEPRLKRSLGVADLFQPPVEEDSRGVLQGTVPYFVFPRFLICPRCRHLADASEFPWNSSLARYECQKGGCPGKGAISVIPSRFVVACPNGHLSDFPYRAYAHDDPGASCPGPLRLIDTGLTGSLADLQVSCTQKGCGAKRGIGDAFSVGLGTQLGGCNGHRPWLGPTSGAETCDRKSVPMLRGASNAYFPVTRSALQIPPWTSPAQEAVGRHWATLARVQSADDMSMMIALSHDPELAKHDPADLFREVGRRRGIEPRNQAQLLWDEWLAFRNPPPVSARRGFDIVRLDPPQQITKWFSGLVQAQRLVEIRTILGFTRVDSPPDSDTLQGPANAQLVRLAQPGQVSWLPAVRTRGEGIMIEFDRGAVLKWKARPEVVERERQFSSALRSYCQRRGLPESRIPSSQYVLVHSFAHGLMQYLSIASGYSIASVRERIYCDSSDAVEMVGVLIYTAVPDSEGSLGGLVELAHPSRFGNLIEGALSNLEVCTSDPLCGEGTPDSETLNGSACHGCLLLPETSCERGNTLLDRTLLCRTFEGSDRSYFLI